MKKFVLVLTVLLLSVPALAVPSNVTISAVPVGTDEVEIRYLTDANLPRAFGLDITTSVGNFIDITDYNVGESNDTGGFGYGIFVGTMGINSSGNVTDYNNPLAEAGVGGALGGMGTGGVTIELGSLYLDDSNKPLASGLLCTLRLDITGGSATVSFAENTARGGVVMEDPDEDPNVRFVDGVLDVMLDYGDAPDTPYPTLFASNGARHAPVGVTLGVNRDTEIDGQPNASATGDDIAGATPDDEDGVTIGIVTTITGAVNVSVSADCNLNAWVDFTNDGDWDDAGEQIFTDEPLTAGANPLVFAVPAGAEKGTWLVSRWRVNDAGGLGYEGLAGDGEVEDYNSLMVVCHVPDVVDDPCDAAIAEIIANGFTVNVIEECNDIIADGNVIRTDPEYCNYPGCGTEVDVYVSTGSCAPPECYEGPDLAEWRAVGSPDSWCWDDQCHGDADNTTEGGKVTFRVLFEDLDILLANWADAGDNLAADFSHSTEGGKVTFRVLFEDLDILLANWADANGPLADCNTPGATNP